MCDQCQKWYASLPAGDGKIKVMPLQSELDDLALHQFRKAKQITDSRKLDALMPAWIKHHHAVHSIPKRKEFVPGLLPQFPGWVTQQNKQALSFFNRLWH